MNNLFQLAKECGATVIDTPEDRDVSDQIVFNKEQLEAFALRVRNERLVMSEPVNQQLLKALKGVVKVADRAVDEFDRAREAIAAAEQAESPNLLGYDFMQPGTLLLTAEQIEAVQSDYNAEHLKVVAIYEVPTNTEEGK